MRKTVFEVAVAVAAGAIMLLVTTVVGSMSTTVRWILAAATAVVAFGVAWFAARGSAGEDAAGEDASGDRAGGVDVGSGMEAGRDARIEDVRIESGAAPIRVGRKMRAKRDARISRIDARNDRKSEQ